MPQAEYSPEELAAGEALFRSAWVFVLSAPSLEFVPPMQGAEVACRRARQVVQANGAQTTSCRTDGLDVLVETSARVWVGWAATATGRARAGPVDEAWSRW